MIIRDPIVEEIHRIRRAIAAKFNYDIDAIADDAKKREGKDGRKVIQPPRRKRQARTKSRKTAGTR